LMVIVEALWSQLDQAQQAEETILAAAKEQAKQHPEIKLLDSIPGVGFINAATIAAILETPTVLLIRERSGPMLVWQ